MRRMDSARETRREEVAAQIAEKEDQLLAESVQCSLGFGGGTQLMDRWIVMYVHVMVQNNSDNRTATNIKVHYPPLYGDKWRTLSSSLRPGDQYLNNESAQPAFEVAPWRDSFKGVAEFRYTIGGKNWSRRNGEAPHLI